MGHCHEASFIVLKVAPKNTCLFPSTFLDEMSLPQACHAMYLEDCQAVFGKLFGHDDSINDRAPGLQLENGFQRTARLYAETFGRPYTFAGGMWRGPAPPTNMASNPVRAVTAGTRIDSVSLEGRDPSGSPTSPSAGILQDSTNASRDPIRSAQAQSSEPPAGHAQAELHGPGKGKRGNAPATGQGEGRQHAQDGGVVRRTSRKGFLQRVSQLLRPSKGTSSRKVKKQEQKDLTQEPSNDIVHQFRVAPAAARDSSGNALGHKDGDIILPCYEADQALSGGCKLCVCSEYPPALLLPKFPRAFSHIQTHMELVHLSSSCTLHIFGPS